MSSKAGGKSLNELLEQHVALKWQLAFYLRRMLSLNDEQLSALTASVD